MGSTLLQANDLRIASTAALGAGTKALEGASMRAVVAACPITASLSGSIIPAGTLMYWQESGWLAAVPAMDRSCWLMTKR
jgi:hypothetical protein